MNHKCNSSESESRTESRGAGVVIDTEMSLGTLHTFCTPSAPGHPPCGSSSVSVCRGYSKELFKASHICRGHCCGFLFIKTFSTHRAQWPHKVTSMTFIEVKTLQHPKLEAVGESAELSTHWAPAHRLFSQEEDLRSSFCRLLFHKGTDIRYIPPPACFLSGQLFPKCVCVCARVPVTTAHTHTHTHCPVQQKS